MSESEEALFTATFPSDVIAEVMEAHFNKAVFKQKVRVVDLRMQADMCMFSLAWIPHDAPPHPAVTSSIVPNIPHKNGSTRRNAQGRFVALPVAEE